MVQKILAPTDVTAATVVPNLSAGLDFENKLFAKVNLPEILRDELAKKNSTCKPINIGSNTDRTSR